MSKVKRIKIGDRVRFSDSFIATLNHPAELIGHRGTVSKLHKIGFPKDMTEIATVEWDTDEPSDTATCNLTLEGGAL